MYYRRKILLAMLDVFDSHLAKLDLQKLMLVFTNTQAKPSFYFVPYKYGAFSFQANADLKTMIKYNQVKEDNNKWFKIDTKNYLKEISNTDRLLMIKLLEKFKDFETDDLIKYTYLNYPYYAIKSKIAAERLSKNDFDKIRSVIPYSRLKKLYTIGYEGLTSEEYFNKLIKLDIKVLCDVRNYPKSMKYGFSKNQLINACENLGMKYVHLPGLGIISDKRKELNSQIDYDNLFEEYNDTTLKTNLDDQQYILTLLDKFKRVALTCFEKKTHQCHRIPLSKSIKELSKNKLGIKNI